LNKKLEFIAEEEEGETAEDSAFTEDYVYEFEVSAEEALGIRPVVVPADEFEELWAEYANHTLILHECYKYNHSFTKREYLQERNKLLNQFRNNWECFQKQYGSQRKPPSLRINKQGMHAIDEYPY
jgi:hypothetical protein